MDLTGLKGPLLISFEGVDGSGKSTQASLVKDRLQEMGLPVVMYREPGGTPLSERIRTLLLDPDLDINPLAELLLFSAARAQLVNSVIQPALDNGSIVILDRFFDSTVAYQGAGRGILDQEWIREFNAVVTSNMSPDRTYYIAIQPEDAAARLGTSKDRMEQTGLEFFQRVADGYEHIAQQEAGRVLRLDGKADIDAIHKQIWSDLLSALQTRHGTHI